MNVPRWLAWSALSIAILCASSSALFVRAAQDGASSLAIAAWRTVIAAVVMVAVTVPRRRREISTVTRREAWVMAAAGVCLAIHFAGWISSLAFTSVALSVTLVNTAPLFVTGLSAAVTGERPSGRSVLGAVVATVGAAVIGATCDASSQGDDLLGAIGAFVGAIGLAGYLLVGRAAGDRLPLDVYVAGVYAAAAGTLLIAAVVMRVPMWGYDATTWRAILGLAFVCQLVGHTATNLALRWVSAAAVSTVLLSEPVLATAAAFTWLGERVGLGELVGASVVLVGIVIAVRAERTTSPLVEPTPEREIA